MYFLASVFLLVFEGSGGEGSASNPATFPEKKKVGGGGGGVEVLYVRTYIRSAGGGGFSYLMCW